jgi:hypothetical protein
MQKAGYQFVTAYFEQKIDKTIYGHTLIGR